MHRLVCLVIFCVTWLVSNLSAARDGSILQLYQQAKLNDAEYNQAQTEVKINTAKQRQSVANLLPQLTLNVKTDWLDSSSTFFDRYKEQKRYEISLEQDIYNPQKIANYQLDSLQKQQSFLIAQQADSDLIIKISQLYFAVQLAQLKQQNLAKELTHSQQRLELVQQQFELGDTNSADVQEVITRNQLVKINLLQAENDLVERKRQLTDLTKLTSVTAKNLTKYRLVKLNLLPAATELNLFEQARMNSLILKQQQLNTRIARANLNQAKTDFLPRLTASLVASKQQGMPQFAYIKDKWIKDNRLNLTLTWPIFNSGASIFQMQQQAFRLTQAQLTYDQQQLQVANQVKKLIAQRQLAENKYHLLKGTLEANQRLVSAMQVAYDEGLRSHIDILDAQEKLFNTQYDLLDTLQQLWLSELQIKASIVKLSEQDVQQLDAVLQLLTTN